VSEHRSQAKDGDDPAERSAIRITGGPRNGGLQAASNGIDSASLLPGRFRRFRTGVNARTVTFVVRVNKVDTLAVADRPWFEAHVRLLARPAYQFSLMLTQNPAIAEEVLQEALTQLWATATTPAELARLCRRSDEVACYVVEVCPQCAWNHLARMYPAGGRHRVSARRAVRGERAR